MEKSGVLTSRITILKDVFIRFVVVRKSLERVKSRLYIQRLCTNLTSEFWLNTPLENLFYVH